MPWLRRPAAAGKRRGTSKRLPSWLRNGPSPSPPHRRGVAALAVGLRESHLSVADSAVPPFEKVDHAVLCRPLPDADEDVGVAELAAAPYGMLRVREDD